MSDIRPSTPERKTHTSDTTARASQAGGWVPPQARRDFDAAIRRAGERSDSRLKDQDDPEPNDLSHTEAPPPGLWGQLPPLTGHTGSAGESSTLMGGSAALTAPAQPTGLLPDSLPMAPHAAAPGVGTPLRLQVPLGGAEAATLALRLAQSGNGQWQLRMGTDATTRQQLNPHLERLRDRLREHSHGRMDDLGFDDDIVA